MCALITPAAQVLITLVANSEWLAENNPEFFSGQRVALSILTCQHFQLLLGSRRNDQRWNIEGHKQNSLFPGSLIKNKKKLKKAVACGVVKNQALNIVTLQYICYVTASQGPQQSCFQNIVTIVRQGIDFISKRQN